MSDELRECPFCGAPGAVENMPERSKAWSWFPMCSKCSVTLGGFETKKKGIIAWNTRPIEDALRAEVLRLNAQYYEMETYGCPDCNGDGEIKGNTCFTCNGHGVLYVKPNEAAE